MYVKGPITPCSVAAGGAVFVRVRTPNLTGTWPHPTDWLISNFLIALTGISYSSPSVCYCGVSSTSGTLMHPNLVHLLLIIN